MVDNLPSPQLGVYRISSCLYKAFIHPNGSCVLAGGWTNPFENMLVKLGSSSPIFGLKIKNIWVATTQFLLFHPFFTKKKVILPGKHVPWKSMVGRCIPYWNRISEPSLPSITYGIIPRFPTGFQWIFGRKHIGSGSGLLWPPDVLYQSRKTQGPSNIWGWTLKWWVFSPTNPWGKSY